MRPVRITAFPARWLTERNSFSNSNQIEWSTGEGTQLGDIQIFAVSSTLGHRRELADDPRLDAVHSIWEALSSPLDRYLDDEEWPIQARFKLLVKLENPVPKVELIRAGLLKRAWPQGSRAKLLKTDYEIRTLADVLSKNNAKNRPAIVKALVRRSASGSGDGAPMAAKKLGNEPNAAEVALEETFVEGEKRAARATARNPKLRSAAKKRWGLKCYCCGFDYEQFYGGIAKGLAIVHHLQLFAQANGKRNATVEDVRVVCANCHHVVHVQNPPMEVDELKGRIQESWTLWTKKGITPRQ